MAVNKSVYNQSFTESQKLKNKDNLKGSLEIEKSEKPFKIYAESKIQLNR